MAEVMLKKTKNYLVVKIPLKAVEQGEATLSPQAQKVIDEAIAEGLADIKAGRVFGPFKDVGEFKKSLREPSSER